MDEAVSSLLNNQQAVPSDNGWALGVIKKGNKAVFIRRRYKNNIYYFAANRAARRVLYSTKFQKQDVQISTELNAFS